MTLSALREHLLSLPGATEDTPFGPEYLVYRIAGKMFALVRWQTEPMQVNLKCNPDLALLLREIHPEVTPGWHMNKLLCRLHRSQGPRRMGIVHGKGQRTENTDPAARYH